MLSDRFYLFISLTVPILYISGISRYNWCPKSRLFHKPSPSDSSYIDRVSMALHRLNMCAIIYVILFLCFQVVRFYVLKDFENMIYLLAFFFVSLISLQAIFITVAFSNEFYFINNIILVFTRKVERKKELHKTLFKKFKFS